MNYVLFATFLNYKLEVIETNIRETTKKMYIYYSFPKIFLEAIAIFVIIFIAFFLLNVLNLDRI